MSTTTPTPASASRPHFVDNRDGNTLDKALCEHLRELRERQQFIFSLDIVTAFFNVPGFDLLADEFCQASKVRLLLGAEPRPEAERVSPQPGDPPEPQFTARIVAEGLKQLDDALARSRDLLPFDEASDAAVRRLLEVLHSGRVEVKRYTKRFLHAKAYLFRTPGGGLVTGSSNFTYSGLRKNLELNLGHFDVPAVPRVEAWFDDLWDKAEQQLAQVARHQINEYIFAPPLIEDANWGFLPSSVRFAKAGNQVWAEGNCQERVTFIVNWARGNDEIEAAFKNWINTPGRRPHQKFEHWKTTAPREHLRKLGAYRILTAGVTAEQACECNIKTGKRFYTLYNSPDEYRRAKKQAERLLKDLFPPADT